MTRSHNELIIEPGLLPLFRIFIGTILFLLILRSGLVAAFQDQFPFVSSPWIGLVIMTLLLAYLFSTTFQQRLGRSYLPMAIVIVVALTLLGTRAGLSLRIEAGVPIAEQTRSTWFLIVLLIVPVIMIAWQYGFRWVVWFCIITSLVELGLFLPLAGKGGPAPPTMIAVVLGHWLIYLPVGYAVARLMDAQRRQRTALAEANAKLARYAETLEQLAIDRERNRLAQELHDTLAHGLSSIAVQLEAMTALWQTQPQNLHAMLAEVLSTTRTALSESRRAIIALRASPLEDLGLTKAVRQLAETAANRSGLELQLQVAEMIDKLSNESEHGLYRIAAEAITNVVRHAKAQRLTVKLEEVDDVIQLCISDDGCGFDSQHAFDTEHFGLSGMHERAQQMGSEFEVTSSLESGTSVQLTLRRKP